MTWNLPANSHVERNAEQVVAFIRQNPSCSIARIMGEFDITARGIHNAVAFARRVQGIPVATVRFGAKGHETYYEIRDAWPEGERLS